MDLTFSSSSLPLLLISILFLVTCLKPVRSFRSKKPKKLPPGPWRLPIIGSAHHILRGGGNSVLHRRVKELSN
ncbi:hypothetical protein QN277_018441 [Acacia crassicarpa]|uniref:Uncharacterized protein n=1 Tax=Acacia crassicarpa TaxID=499986 RepID=A0AAE1JVT7_9FABA|nr:hypothetical protein QN277_018441 [Acacia crassicarpa]